MAGQFARAVVVPARRVVTLLWFIDHDLQGGQDFLVIKDTADCAETMRRHLVEAAGWREPHCGDRLAEPPEGVDS